MKKDDLRYDSMTEVTESDPKPSSVNNEDRQRGSDAISRMNKSRFSIESKELSGSLAKVISKLPSTNQNFFLCLLEVLFLFQEKSEVNFMTTYNLSAIFQPGIFNHDSQNSEETALKMFISKKFQVSFICADAALLYSSIKKSRTKHTIEVHLRCNMNSKRKNNEILKIQKKKKSHILIWKTGGL